MNKLNYDEIIEKYDDKFRIDVTLDHHRDDYTDLLFYDKNDGEFYFYVYGKSHPGKSEIECDLEEFEHELNEAILKIKKKRLKKKFRQIKKDF